MKNSSKGSWKQEFRKDSLNGFSKRLLDEKSSRKLRKFRRKMNFLLERTSRELYLIREAGNLRERAAKCNYTEWPSEFRYVSNLMQSTATLRHFHRCTRIPWPSINFGRNWRPGLTSRATIKHQDSYPRSDDQSRSSPLECFNADDTEFSWTSWNVRQKSAVIARNWMK